MDYVRLPGVLNGLLVNDINSENEEHDGLWKLSYVFDETPYLLSTVSFVRRHDAERAKAAVESLVDWSGTPSEVRNQLEKRGITRRKFNQLMAESIQW